VTWGSATYGISRGQVTFLKFPTCTFLSERPPAYINSKCRMDRPKTFDFVIVGAGAAGCLLAERLTRSGQFTVAVLEVGVCFILRGFVGVFGRN
jgi:hypothetical protein